MLTIDSFQPDLINFMWGFCATYNISMEGLHWGKNRYLTIFMLNVILFDIFAALCENKPYKCTWVQRTPRESALSGVCLLNVATDG